MARLGPARDAGKETRGTIMTKVSSRSGQRFAGLQAALKEMSRPVSGERIASLKRGDASPSPAPTVAPRAAAAEAKRAAPATQPTAAAAPPKPAPMAVPASVASRGELFANAYRKGFARVCAKLGRVTAHPAAIGRMRAAMQMVVDGHSEESIIARLPTASTDREVRIDALWDRAIASATGEGQLSNPVHPAWAAAAEQLQNARI